MSTTLVHPKDFTKALLQRQLNPVVQVPCSYFKSFIDYLLDTNAIEVISPVNEAVAMGIAAGRYLATGNIPIVAIQNSGLMNTLNALTSLQQIYEIPVFYIITWRGEGGKGSDVPAHDVTGVQMEQILTTFLLPYEIFDPLTYINQIDSLVTKALETKKPVALILKKNTFEPYKTTEMAPKYPMSRYDAMLLVKEAYMDEAVFISSTGYPSRDSFTIKDTPDFYMVGSMGHVFASALGLSPFSNKKIVALDGDGSCLMHLGGLASFDPEVHTNIVYIVFDNESYESTGGQPTLSSVVDFKSIAKAFRFPKYLLATDKKSLQECLSQIVGKPGSVFIHIKVETNIVASGNLPSDIYSCVEIKDRFMDDFSKEAKK